MDRPTLLVLKDQEISPGQEQLNARGRGAISSGNAELLWGHLPHHSTAILHKPFLKVYKQNLKKVCYVITEEKEDTKE